MFRYNPTFATPATAAALLVAVAACRPTTSTTRSPDAFDAPVGGARGGNDLSDEEALSQQKLVCAVLAANPDLAAWREQWRAASARTDQPTSLGDTSISYSFAPASIGSSAVRYGQVVQIEQSFRLGQTKLERRVARAQAEVAGHDYDAQRQHLALLSADLYHEYYALTRALETNAEHEALVNAIADVATVRYATGHAPQQDPIQADLELAHIEHEKVVLASQRDVVAAQINGLLHRPPDTPLPPPPDRLDTVPEREDDEGEWQRPEIGAAAAEEHAADETITLSRRRFTPSVRAMGSYNSMWPEIQHQFMVGVGVSIPLQVKALRAGVAEAEARRRAASYRRQAVDDRVAVETSAAAARLREAHHVVELHRVRLLPTAKSRVEAARVGYETGANDFSAVIEAERELRSLELDYHRALADLNQRKADLDFARGRPPGCDDEGADR